MELMPGTAYVKEIIFYGRILAFKIIYLTPVKTFLLSLQQRLSMAKKQS